MTDKPESDLTAQMKEAEEFLKDGDVSSALILIMDVWQRQLDNLGNALKAIQDELDLNQDEVAISVTQVRPYQPFTIWPQSTSYLLH